MRSPSTYTAGMRRLCLLVAVSVVLVVAPPRAQTTGPARNVILITIDGLRWQEFFGGADREHFKRDRNGSGGEPERRFWRDNANDRRSLLMPFMWATIAKQGQIFGDPSADSLSRLTNGLWFSYPATARCLSAPTRRSTATIGAQSQCHRSRVAEQPAGL